MSKTYYREGQLASAQIMNNGVQQGVSRQWYKNGQLKCEEPYDNNKLNGNIKNWYETGQLKIQIAYKQGIKEGYCLEYYPNGQLKKKHYFKNNSETEIYEIYDKKGTLIKSSHNDSMMRLAPQMGFFEFPELVEHASRQLLEIINDQLYLVQDFYETGDKLTDPYYLLSKEEAYQTKVNLRRCFPSEATGLFKEYDRSGNLICQGSFLDGYRQGKWLVWQQQSDNNYYLQETSVYNKNILQRKITWHKNGCKQSEAIYNDKKEIILGRYNDDGSLCQSFLIKLLNANNGGCICRKIIENKKNGCVVQDFFYSGEKATNPYTVKKLKEVQTCMFSQQFTSIVGELLEWYTSLSTNLGELTPSILSLYSLSAHNKGSSFGHAMTAYNKQQMATKHYYNKQGKLSGLYQCWYSNGQKEREGVVINGKKNGTWHYWEMGGDKTIERFFLLGITIKTKHLKSVS